MKLEIQEQDVRREMKWKKIVGVAGARQYWELEGVQTRVGILFSLLDQKAEPPTSMGPKKAESKKTLTNAEYESKQRRLQRKRNIRQMKDELAMRRAMNDLQEFRQKEVRHIAVQANIQRKKKIYAENRFAEQSKKPPQEISSKQRRNISKPLIASQEGPNSNYNEVADGRQPKQTKFSKKERNEETKNNDKTPIRSRLPKKLVKRRLQKRPNYQKRAKKTSVVMNKDHQGTSGTQKNMDEQTQNIAEGNGGSNDPSKSQISFIISVCHL